MTCMQVFIPAILNLNVFLSPSCVLCDAFGIISKSWSMTPKTKAREDGGRIKIPKFCLRTKDASDGNLAL